MMLEVSRIAAAVSMQYEWIRGIRPPGTYSEDAARYYWQETSELIAVPDIGRVFDMEVRAGLKKAGPIL